MCILFLAINRHPNYPLIVAANRDEHHRRPSQPMHYWPDHPEILAGRDLHKGGAWIGANAQGRFCAVTNFRTGRAAHKNKCSRGALVVNYLQNKTDHDEFVEYLTNNRQNFNPFNLIFGNKSAIHIFCSLDGALKTLQDGCHGLSNGFIDQHWPKMSAGVLKLTELVEKNTLVEIAALNEIMHDQTKAQDDQLPDTGVGREMEKLVSSIFVRDADYGTRATTYLLYSDTNVRVHEINYNDKGETTDSRAYRITPRP